MLERFANYLVSRYSSRMPSFIVGQQEDPYLHRWYIIPRNRFFNVYLHRFMRDDEDRALHDHPWMWCSLVLLGSYKEHTILHGGIEVIQYRFPGNIKVSLPSRAHRISLLQDYNGKPIECWTLFFTGPVVRQWGFHCRRGWVHFKDFTNPDNTGITGRGCDE